jgi:regulator of protease activity HflC (stomatin/prohibitin superfamily)
MNSEIETIHEKRMRAPHGFVQLFCLLGGIALGIVLTAAEVPAVGVPLIVVCFVCLFGCFVVQPNEARVLQLFGKYVGSVRDTGLRWANPFYAKKHVSLRARSFETARLKVNDRDGNPIEIGAVVVWAVVDSAQAVFNVERYGRYVHVQSESALRNLASRYHYDSSDDQEHSLRGSTADVAEQLRGEIQERVSNAGVRVIEARIAHLAYAPEIAGAMLRRQQAGAVIAARQKIVEGAVGMVEMALDLLSKKQVVTLDEERKASMVSNLLVVLCAEQEAQPIVNAGSIYS